MTTIDSSPGLGLGAFGTGLTDSSPALTPRSMLRRLPRGATAVLERPKILIVEDNPDLTMALGLRMREHGFAVVCAAGRIEAVRIAMEERPDAIVLDLGLPDGTGFDVMHVVRNVPALAGTLIFVVSGWDARSSVSRAQEFGIARYFTKPVDSGVLVRAIHQMLDD